ncbi:MAG TPA: aldose epimerase family protein [Oceanipulchritudo sp.]|nr:aldose epimerase family protein [Oceanipulchritudo sp.]
MRLLLRTPILILTAATLSWGGVSVAPFGQMPDGRLVSLFTLVNEQGITAKITNFGGIMTELQVPDRDGELGDIVLGHDTLEAYLEGTPYFGALIGRYGNRIGGGRFDLEGEAYQLATNDGDNHLHGGEQGFDKVLWRAEPDSGKTALRLSYVSGDGEEGYPGELTATVVYELTDANELIIRYEATTTDPTVVNLTQHNYYNLRGQGKGSIVDHELLINADRFTPVGPGLIPTGELAGVEGTAMDFRRSRPIGSRLEPLSGQLELGGGYDHNWVLNKDEPGRMSLAARLYDPDSGREMIIETTEPGLQFYSGNFLDGTITGKDGMTYYFRYGLCLETQHFPDSPNQPGFPSTRLDPGETYRSVTRHTFSTQ